MAVKMQPTGPACGDLGGVKRIYATDLPSPNGDDISRIIGGGRLIKEARRLSVVDCRLRIDITFMKEGVHTVLLRFLSFFNLRPLDLLRCVYLLAFVFHHYQRPHTPKPPSHLLSSFLNHRRNKGPDTLSILPAESVNLNYSF